MTIVVNRGVNRVRYGRTFFLYLPHFILPNLPRLPLHKLIKRHKIPRLIHLVQNPIKPFFIFFFFVSKVQRQEIISQKNYRISNLSICRSRKSLFSRHSKKIYFDLHVSTMVFDEVFPSIVSCDRRPVMSAIISFFLCLDSETYPPIIWSSDQIPLSL